MRDGYEKEMVDFCRGADCDGVVYLAGRRSGDALMELAAADAIRMEDDHLLAGARLAGALPASVWELDGPGRSAREFSAAHGREVGADDAGGARKIPARDASALRVWRGDGGRERAGVIGPGELHGEVVIAGSELRREAGGGSQLRRRACRQQSHPCRRN